VPVSETLKHVNASSADPLQDTESPPTSPRFYQQH
jgi:hypothetical protein